MTDRLDSWRQMGIVSSEDLTKLRVTIIGCGGIGSPTTLALGKMGVEKITVWDPDFIENHNLRSQIYRIADAKAKKAKVVALAEICKDFSGLEIKVKAERFDGKQQISGLVISGVDSMESRKDIWQKIKFNPLVPLYIDGRMGAEVATIYSLNPCDPEAVRFYESKLYDASKTVELPCTARAIIYNVFSIAALISNQVKKFASGEPLNKEIIFDLKTLSLLTN